MAMYQTEYFVDMIVDNGRSKMTGKFQTLDEAEHGYRRAIDMMIAAEVSGKVTLAYGSEIKAEIIFNQWS